MWIFVFVYARLSACVISSTMDIFTGSVRYLLRIYLRVVNYVVKNGNDKTNISADVLLVFVAICIIFVVDNS